MKKLYLIVALLVSGFMLFPAIYAQDYGVAYTYRTGTPDPVVQNLPRSIESYRSQDPARYIQEIASYIVSNSTDDFDKVKKVHDWIALNIKYDVASFFSGNIPAQTVVNVIGKGSAVCQGYSTVFKALCDAMEIQCELVSGYGRGYGSSTFVIENPTDSNHAWNKVKINGNWYLIDCTWDAGYVDGRNYKANYSTGYLFLKPEFFIYQHFPDDKSQQLLSTPLSPASFSSLPALEPVFFEIISVMNPDLQRINRLDGAEFALEFYQNPDVIISFNIYDENGSRQIQNATFTQKEGELHRAYFSFPNAGNYLIRCFSRKPSDKTASLIGEFGIIASKGSTVKYPTQYSNFDPDITIFNPLAMPLQHNVSYEFKLKVDKQFVAVIVDKQWNYLTANADGIFSGIVAIPAGTKTVQVAASDAKNKSYSTIVQYEIK